MGRNEKTRRGDATTSWRDDFMRGRRSKRMARGNATTSWRDKMTRGRRNERATTGDATTSWHDKTTPGLRDERQHSLIVFRVHTESTGEVAAMVMLVLSVNTPERLGVGDELQVVSDVVQKDLRSSRNMKDQQTKKAHCFARVLRGSN